MIQNPGHTEWRPKLSVVIPIFNTDSFFNETIESVIQQDFQDLEVILIGKCEKEHLGEHVLSYLSVDQRFSFFKVDSLKLSTIRNVGLEKANGTYIYFLHADNLLYPDALPNLVHLMYESGSEVIGFSGLSLNEEGNSSGLKNYRKPDIIEPIEGEDLLVEMMASGTYSPEVSMFMFRRSFLQNIQRFISEEYTSEDEFYTIRTLCMADRALSVSNEFYLLREKNESESTDQTIIARLKGWSSAISWMLTFIEKHPLKEITQKMILQRARELGYQLVEMIHQLNEEKSLAISLDHYFTKKELSKLGYGVRIKNMYPGLYNLLLD